jgi:hypothetical protein
MVHFMFMMKLREEIRRIILEWYKKRSWTLHEDKRPAYNPPPLKLLLACTSIYSPTLTPVQQILPILQSGKNFEKIHFLRFDDVKLKKMYLLSRASGDD